MGQQYIPILTYDAGPTGCGELIMKLFLTMKKMNSGEIIEVISYDLGARKIYLHGVDCKNIIYCSGTIMGKLVITLLKKADLVF